MKTNGKKTFREDDTKECNQRFVVVFSVVLFCVAAEEGFHCTTLDSEDKFHVCWKVIELEDGDRDIIFKLEVKTHGYVGFGLSSNGGMTGSDIVTGWVKNGQVYFQDRYGEGNFLPKIDEIQSWNLVSGRENDTHTTLIFRRKLDTCDKEDRKIDDSTTKLIYAYSDEDPKRKMHSSTISKAGHEERPPTANEKIPSSRSRQVHSVLLGCFVSQTPRCFDGAFDSKRVTRGFVHHILLYECVGGSAEAYDPHLDQHGHECHRPNMPDAMKKCEGIFLAWAVGGENLVLPEDVGLPLEISPAKYYMMEIHYDNPGKVEGIIDHSGLRIYYTPKVEEIRRRNPYDRFHRKQRLIVPPGRKKYVVAGHSNPTML
ncbi:DBH-like monooxygenase protein 1 [Caerostris extrusa]|uniref:DBH-like monooxygenase protein 1 n=1 Tax=Caerostris extrusa TaxID=172846 RepID=A0AAV4V1G2_CAEEX|nr:DBH-like monooxygenase protein 1 [Caerostris extrusa]